MSWKCRVYRGLNRGVEVPLTEGRLVIGADPLKADLVLVDEGMAAEHLVLLVSGEGITLQAWADGITPTQDGVALTAGETLRAGTRLEAGPLLWSFCDNSRSLPEQLEALAAVVAPSRAPRRRAAGAGRSSSARPRATRAPACRPSACGRSGWGATRCRAP